MLANVTKPRKWVSTTVSRMRIRHLEPARRMPLHLVLCRKEMYLFWIAILAALTGLNGTKTTPIPWKEIDDVEKFWMRSVALHRNFANC